MRRPARLPAVVLAVLAAAGAARGQTPAERLSAAEQAFTAGVELRADSAKARPLFAEAAAHFDVLWDQGHRTPELAIDRARAHRLAGNLPAGIAALHDGLAAARFSRALQTELEDARAAVPFPIDGDLADQCRPEPVRGVSARLSPADAWVLSGALWLLACAGAARYVMTRNARWLAFAGGWLAALLLFGGLWLADARQRARDEARPLLVVTRDALLRKGNADSWEPRLEPALPAGSEVRELSRRGGWVQVVLPGGAVGWLPERATRACGG